MAAEKISIEKFLELHSRYPVLDVRSPGEYHHAHLPGAYSFPLFTDEERKVVGTAYKQQGRETAIKIGLDYFGVKMRRMVEEAETLSAKSSKSLLVHCWRGGMRSAGVAWLLDLYGFKVYTLAGGYKSFRHWVLLQFEKPHALNILGGYTGSGKTRVLKELEKFQEPVIDLEGLAHHKGSAFGALGEEKQPSQEMFENCLAMELMRFPGSSQIWLEDESQRIGLVNLPNSWWNQMRTSPVYFLNLPFAERLDYIEQEYGKFKKEQIAAAIIRIQKRLGGLETKTAINFLMEDRVRDCFSILLKYYDKLYLRGLNKREHLNQQLRQIDSNQIDPELNARQVLELSGKMLRSA